MEADLGVVQEQAQGPDALPRVLVVDDNPINQEVAAAMLEYLGCEVDLAAGGKEAVQAIADRTYDLVLMDCHMPVLNGYETTELIRRNEGVLRHTPIVAMTAAARLEDRQHCLASGMDDYLSKPVFLEVLQAILTRWIPHATFIDDGSAVALG